MKHHQRLSIVLLLTILLSFSLSLAQETGESLSAIESQLALLTDEEREILDELFTLVQEIEEIQRLQALLEGRLLQMEEKIPPLTASIEEQERLYVHHRDLLGEVLKSYQRRGPASYLEILLASDSLRDLVRRLNVLKELTRNTGELLDTIALEQERLLAEKDALHRLMADIETQQRELDQVLQENLAIQAELEDRLESLQEERAAFEARLSQLERAWTEVQALFTTFVSEFNQLMDAGNLPEDALQLHFSLREIKGTLSESSFNQALEEISSIEGMVIRFRPDQILVEIPERRFQLAGVFEVIDGHTLRFIAREGTFHGMRLTDASINELFSEGVIELNLEPVLYGNQLHEVRIRQGAMELISRISLF